MVSCKHAELADADLLDYLVSEVIQNGLDWMAAAPALGNCCSKLKVYEAQLPWPV